MVARVPPVSAAAARQQHAARYTRFVRNAKILLPIGALLLLASIFISGKERAGLEDLLSAEEIARLGAGLRLDSPRFAGTTENGEPFLLSADAALPSSAVPDKIGLEAPRGRIAFSDGLVIEAEAHDGLMHRSEESLDLTGDVRISTSDGYLFETGRLILDLAQKGAEAPGKVMGSGPEGTLEAGRLTIVDGEGGFDGARFVFEGGVRLLFTPAEKD